MASKVLTRKGLKTFCQEEKTQWALQNHDNRLFVEVVLYRYRAGIPGARFAPNRIEKRDYDRHLYKARHLIENFFAKLKKYRAIATRYDKTAINFLGSIHACCFCYLA